MGSMKGEPLGQNTRKIATWHITFLQYSFFAIKRPTSGAEPQGAAPISKETRDTTGIFLDWRDELALSFLASWLSWRPRDPKNAVDGVLHNLGAQEARRASARGSGRRSAPVEPLRRSVVRDPGRGQGVWRPIGADAWAGSRGPLVRTQCGHGRGAWTAFEGSSGLSA
jgi:hypothetical protein